MNILHITPWYPTDASPANGIFVREHIRASARRHDCLVWAFYDHPDFATPRFQRADSEEYGLRTVRTYVPYGRLPKIRYLIRLRTLLKFGARLIKDEFKPDLIHAHTFHAGVVGAKLGKRFGVPMIFTEHWSGFQRGLLNRMDLLKLRYALRRARRVLPVSRFLSDILKGYGVPANFTVVPNIVDIEVFHPSGTPLPLLNEGVKLLAVSGLNPRKGIPLMLQAMRILKDSGVEFHLNIDGDGPNRAEYEALANELDLTDNVTFLGWLPTKSDIADLMRSHHIFVHSASDETFSVVTAEAVCCGLPVVAFDIPPLSERINQSNGMLVKPGDPQALADGIKSVLSNYSRYDRAAISRAAGEYSLDSVGAQFDQIYREVTAM